VFIGIWKSFEIQMQGLLILFVSLGRNPQFQNKLERTVSPEKEEPKTQILQATTTDKVNQISTNKIVQSSSKSGKSLLAFGLAVLLLSVIGFLHTVTSRRTISKSNQSPFCRLKTEAGMRI
jgi:hypothetical protein